LLLVHNILRSFTKKKETIQISDVKVDICSLGLTSKVHNQISWNFLEISVKFGSKMADTGDEDIPGGQDIHQNSWNFKYFSVVMVPFLCRSNLFYSVEACIFKFKYLDFESEIWQTMLK
jgi:hypothetical protein